jgi:hypothetical protein
MFDYTRYLLLVRWIKAYPAIKTKGTMQHIANITKIKSANGKPLVQPIIVIRRRIMAVTIAALARVSFIDCTYILRGIY